MLKDVEKQEKFIKKIFNKSRILFFKIRKSLNIVINGSKLFKVIFVVNCVLLIFNGQGLIDSVSTSWSTLRASYYSNFCKIDFFKLHNYNQCFDVGFKNLRLEAIEVVDSIYLYNIFTDSNLDKKELIMFESDHLIPSTVDKIDDTMAVYSGEAVSTLKVVVNDNVQGEKIYYEFLADCGDYEFSNLLKDRPYCSIEITNIVSATCDNGKQIKSIFESCN